MCKLEENGQQCLVKEKRETMKETLHDEHPYRNKTWDGNGTLAKCELTINMYWWIDMIELKHRMYDCGNIMSRSWNDG
jgi:hypothetical protein